jgi:hypothetical protein
LLSQLAFGYTKGSVRFRWLSCCTVQANFKWSPSFWGSLKRLNSGIS